MRTQKILKSLCAVAIGTVLTLSTDHEASAKARVYTSDSKLACHDAIQHTEQRHRIPVQLLESIAMIESRKWDASLKRSVAWPWTVMAEGKGRYFNTKQEAINEVRKLQRQGVRNIDVGCMQINMKYHPDAFDNLEQAFDPKHNTDYAARFLTKLKSKHRTWSNTIGYYHSGTPHLRKRYAKKVLAEWRDGRQQTAKKSRERARSTREQLMAKRRGSRIRVVAYTN